MSKKTLGILLAILLAVCAVSYSVSIVHAEGEDTEDYYEDYDEDYEDEDYEEETEETESETEKVTTATTAPVTEGESVEPTTEEIVPADFPALTVNAISNYFPKSSADYNVKTKELTVTYWFRSSRNMLTTQWFLSYDPEVLSISKKKNLPQTICPTIGTRAVVRFGKDTVNFNASDMKLFDFATNEVPFAQFVFDVKKLSPDEPITTKIDLTVEELIVSRLDKKTGAELVDEEMALVDDCEENESLGLATLGITRNTSLTPSNFVQATTQRSTEVTTEAPSTAVQTEATDASSSNQAVTQATAPSDDDRKEKEEEPEPLIDTGAIGYAFLCLGVFTVCTSVLFIMRKKEIMY